MFKIFGLPVSFSPSHLKVFFATCIAMFVIVSLQLIGIHAPKLVLPIPEKTDIFLDNVVPKLNGLPNTYHLKEVKKIIPQAGAARGYEDASAYAVIDFNTGEVIAAKNLSASLSIASLTKIMTSIIALDLVDENESFTISEKASKMIPTKIGVVPGEKMLVRELLHATLLTSANDASEVLKEGVDHKYNEKVFVRAMNEKAKFLGLKNTSYTNPQGFDQQNHYSSVEDLALLTHYAIVNYPLIKEITAKDYTFLPKNNSHKAFDLYNWNGLIDVYPAVTGVKIGSTESAKKTTVVLSERNGKKLMAIVLGAPGIIERDKWAADLLDVGYEKELGLAKVNITEDILRKKYQTWQYWN